MKKIMFYHSTSELTNAAEQRGHCKLTYGSVSLMHAHTKQNVFFMSVWIHLAIHANLFRNHVILIHRQG